MFDRQCPLKEAAQEAPDEIAIRTKSEIFTYSEFDSEVDALAMRLKESGLQPGDAYPIEIPPSPEFLFHFFAAIRLGLNAAPLSLRVPETEKIELRKRIPSSLPAAIHLFSSGSTGTPKRISLTLTNIAANAKALVEAVDLKRGDAWLLTLPLYHVGGLGIAFRCILARAQISFDESYAGTTHLSYVPTQLYRSWPVYKQLKCLLLGGGPISETPEHLPIIVTYGMTETGSAILAQKPVWKNGRLFGGFPLPGREMKLVDGEIYVKGDTLSPYLTGLEEGWYPTKDLAIFDPELGYSITGRKDNQFISGGENIQPEEIESKLILHPDVLEAVIVPQDDPEFGKRPVAFVRTASSSFDIREMRLFLSDKLPKFMIPIALFSLDEAKQTGLKPNRKKILEFLSFFSP